MFICLFAVLFMCLLYFSIKLIEEFSIMKKFKVGYYFDTYKLRYHADNSYEKQSTYKIEANGDGYVIVQDRTDGNFGEFKEFKISDLLYTIDKIIIRDENGRIVDTFFKFNYSYDY